MEQKLYAFWSYDEFPYVRSGEVVQINDDSTVEIKNFGKGYRFTPLKIVPLKAGLIIQQDLDKRREEYNHELRKLRDTHFESLRKQWPFIK
jgi:hypothetical protein